MLRYQRVPGIKNSHDEFRPQDGHRLQLDQLQQPHAEQETFGSRGHRTWRHLPRETGQRRGS